MAFSDWDVYKSDSGLYCAINLISPILGTGSLKIKRDAVATADQHVNVTPGTGQPTGYTRGKMRTLLRINAAAGAAGHAAGVLFMQSQDDLTGGSGSAYAALVKTNDTAGTIGDFDLVKYTAGIEDAVPAKIIGESSLALGVESIVAIEVEWNLDVTELGGIYVVGRRGVLTDFSDLADKWETVISTSVLTSSTGESVFVHMEGTGNHETEFDQTSIFEQV